MPVNLELSAIFESHRFLHCDAAYIWYEWDLYLTTVSFQDGSKMALKNVTPGNSVFSMLGILDVLTVREETVFCFFFCITETQTAQLCEHYTAKQSDT